MLISFLLCFRDRNPVCGGRIMAVASVLEFAAAACSGAGAERGSKAIPPGSWGMEWLCRNHIYQTPPQHLNKGHGRD